MWEMTPKKFGMWEMTLKNLGMWEDKIKVECGRLLVKNKIREKMYIKRSKNTNNKKEQIKFMCDSNN